MPATTETDFFERADMVAQAIFAAMMKGRATSRPVG